MGSEFKLSWLSSVEHSPFRVISGLCADETSYAPPEGLLIAGFKCDGTVIQLPSGFKEMEFKEDLVDTVISWSMQGSNAKSDLEKVECVLELDFRDDLPYASIAQLASQGDFSLALVGWDGNEEERANYHEKLAQLGKEVLRLPAFSKRLYPFSIAFEWIFLEELGKSVEAQSQRERIGKALVDILHPSGARQEYALKYACLGLPGIEATSRSILEQHYGSKEEVAQMCKSIVKPIIKRISNFAQEVRTQSKSKIVLEK